MNKFNRFSHLVFFLVFAISANEAVGQTWSNSVNSMDDLQKVYLQKAVHINSAGDVVNGSEAISNFWIGQDLEIQSSQVIFETNTVYKDDHVYEIGSFTTIDNAEFVHLLIEQVTNETSQRKLEFFAERASSDIDLTIIDERRNEWMEYCNAHDAAGLVENLYTENSVYYNHRPVITGREALSQEYQYMNNPRYSLRLIPLHVEVVNDSIIYEIGQCEGSYKGKYMLVWQKNANGEWQILMDSNI